MKERERLIELAKEARLHCNNVSCGDCGLAKFGGYPDCKDKLISDKLLANGVIVPPYKPFPVVLSEDENNADVYCPFCNTDLSGHYYGGDFEAPKIITCFGCGTWLDGTKTVTKEEAKQALKGGGKE